MIKKTVLSCGLVIITEHIPAFPSFALSYTLRSGSRGETVGLNGAHHLVEHMMFKGSDRYDLRQIADISDRLGGRLNAFTGKEVTQYYVKAIDEKLNESFDLLTEIVFNSTFPQDEYLKERNVVLQEIKESQDNPDSHAFDSFYSQIFPDNPLGFPIAGSETGVSTLQRDDLYAFYRKSYRPTNLLLAAVGNINHEDLVDKAIAQFESYPDLAANDLNFQKPVFHPGLSSKKNQSLKQQYVIIGFPGIEADSPSKYPFLILNDILGGGMSSRLFQKIREEKGLAYTIHSHPDAYLDLGLHLIYGIVDPAMSSDYQQAVRDEIQRFKSKGITGEELNRAKDHIKSSILLGLENNVSKMRFNVNQQLYLKEEVPVAEILKTINSVTREQVNELAGEYMDLSQQATFLYGA